MELKYDDMQQVWTTFQGKKVTLDSIDHQHLSNVYWYGRIFFNIIPKNVLQKLAERFNGQVLEYRPHIDFHHELEHLERKGLLVWTKTAVAKVGIITFEGVIIGSVFDGDIFKEENKPLL